MSWDSAKNACDNQSAGKYLRIKDGENARVVFLGEPTEVTRTWEDGSESLRIQICAYLVGRQEVCIWECAPRWFAQLVGARAEYGLERIYRISRHGAGTSTTYTIAPEPGGELTPAMAEKLRALTLPPLDRDAADDVPAAQSTPASDLPF